jgi:serine/threonine protein kinase
LVSIIGVVTSGSPLILLLSYCDHGSMLCHLKKQVADGKAVSFEHKLDFAAQTVRGMAHLSARHFVHRDLAARNVLLTSGKSASTLICKVADFGLSRAGSSKKKTSDSTNSEDYYRSQKGVFAVRWTAPEAMETLVFNQASDVWSFGILLVELVQDGDRPYHELKGNADVMAQTMSGQRHPQPPGCSNGLYAIMMRCWNGEPKLRPSFASLASQLELLRTRTAVWGEDVDGRADTSKNDVTAAQFCGGDSTNSGLAQLQLPGDEGAPIANFETVYAEQTNSFEEMVAASNANFDALLVASNDDFNGLQTAVLEESEVSAGGPTTSATAAESRQTLSLVNPVFKMESQL